MALGVGIRKCDEQVDEVAGGNHVQLPAAHRHHHGQLTTVRFVEDEFDPIKGQDCLRGLIDDFIFIAYCCEKLSHIASLLGERSRCGD